LHYCPSSFYQLYQPIYFLWRNPIIKSKSFARGLGTSYSTSLLLQQIDVEPIDPPDVPIEASPEFESKAGNSDVQNEKQDPQSDSLMMQSMCSDGSFVKCDPFSPNSSPDEEFRRTRAPSEFRYVAGHTG